MTVTAAPAGSAQAHASAYSDRRRKAALQVALLAAGAVVALFLPRLIAGRHGNEEEFKPQVLACD